MCQFHISRILFCLCCAPSSSLNAISRELSPQGYCQRILGLSVSVLLANGESALFLFSLDPSNSVDQGVFCSRRFLEPTDPTSCLDLLSECNIGLENS